MKDASDNVTRIILYSISADRSFEVQCVEFSDI